MPKVSVIIPTYQRAHLVNRAIDSALAQTYHDYEIIVINDGSTDDTLTTLSHYHDRIIPIHQENRGLAAARNAGIQAAQGEYIAFLDDDDLWEPSKLAQQIPLLEADSHIGLIYSDMVIFNEVRTLPGTYLNGFVPPRIVTPWTLLKYGNFFPMPTIVIRRSCLEAVGYFNQDLRYCEDYDLWLRIIEQWSTGYINSPLARYFWAEDPDFQSLSKNTEQMLLTALQVKSAAFDRNPYLQRLSPQYRDICLQPDYLDLAEFYNQNGDFLQAKAILDHYQPTQDPAMHAASDSTTIPPNFADQTTFEQLLSQKIALSHDVLPHPVGHKSILFKLATASEFNLNETATRILHVLLESASIATAYQQLLQEFSIAPNILQNDLLRLLDKLFHRQLIDILTIA